MVENESEARGKLIKTVEDHSDDIKQLQGDVGMIKQDVSVVKAIFHLMTREKELTIKNLELSIGSHLFNRALAIGQLTIWVVMAIWIISHSSRP